jgi:hypothetical protein
VSGASKQEQEQPPNQQSEASAGCPIHAATSHEWAFELPTRTAFAPVESGQLTLQQSEDPKNGPSGQSIANDTKVWPNILSNCFAFPRQA